MPNIALVTGASSGIGRALAGVHAKRGGDLILVARREAELNTLKAELEAAHGITAHVFPCDLAQPGAAETLYAAVKAAGHRVDVLINNAGFGGHGRHHERELQAEQAMIAVNVLSLVALTHEFARDMVAQGGGRILNVGSTAGFMPGPKQAIYFATKAFVNSFSQAVDHEMRRKGVTSTVLVPGYVETEFAKVGDLEGTPMVTSGGMKAEAVAEIGYKGMMGGKLVVFDRFSLSFLLQWVVPFLPRRMVLNMITKMQTK